MPSIHIKTEVYFRLYIALYVEMEIAVTPLHSHPPFQTVFQPVLPVDM